MHDIKYIRENPEDFDAAMARRGKGGQSDAILKLDAERRELQTELQELQATRNAESQKIGEIKKAGGDAAEAMDAVARIKNQMGEIEEREKTLAESLNQHLAGLPNILDADVPDGADENDNVEVNIWGEPSMIQVPEHFEIGEALGMMDAEVAAKMSGSRFTMLSGGLARMERALAQFFLDTHTAENGYVEVSAPLLVHPKALYGTGQLPKFEEDLFDCEGRHNKHQREVVKFTSYINGFYDARDNFSKFLNEIKVYPNNENYKNAFIDLEEDLEHSLAFSNEVLETVGEKLGLAKETQHFLIPTSEVPLTNIVAEEIVDEGSLPRRYTAFTPCFRSEAGSAGKDTRGMIRQHQFYKVEMVGITKPEDSEAEHARMTKCAETILEKLELPYRTVVLCSGDTGFGARKTYDLEVWLPGQQRYREISSVSNCGDFQARRMNARFKREGEKNTTFLHTLNGSGVAVGRALIAVLENYYDAADGGVHVPEVLKPYMGGIEKIVKG